MIQVTAHYALEVDEMNYTLMKFKKIDPTKSPKFKEGDDTTIRYEWRTENRYYPKSTTGLAAALQEIAHREASDKLSDNITLVEYVKLLRDEHSKLLKAVEGVFKC